MKFEDRILINQNRKKIIKLDSDGNRVDEILVDIVDDPDNVTQEGTPINAAMFENLIITAENAQTAANSAQSVADNAQSIANSIAATSNNALATANNAESIANSIEAIAINALNTAENAKEIARGAALGSLSNDNPQPLGIASAGNSTAASKSDHIHQMPTAQQVGAVAVAQGSGNAKKQVVTDENGNIVLKSKATLLFGNTNTTDWAATPIESGTITLTQSITSFSAIEIIGKVYNSGWLTMYPAFRMSVTAFLTTKSGRTWDLSTQGNVRERNIYYDGETGGKTKITFASGGGSLGIVAVYGII